MHCRVQLKRNNSINQTYGERLNWSALIIKENLQINQVVVFTLQMSL